MWVISLKIQRVLFFAFSIENNLYFCTQKETLCQLILTLSKTTPRKATTIQEEKEGVMVVYYTGTSLIHPPNP